MGQQQLLLVILVTIIVGIATVVAINIFGTAADQSNRDAVRQDLMAAAVQAQGVWSKPTMMDGANRDFTNLTLAELLERLNIPSNTYDGTGTTLENENADYVISDPSEFGFTLTATPSSGGEDIIMELSRDETTDRWVVDIDGSSSDDEE